MSQNVQSGQCLAQVDSAASNGEAMQMGALLHSGYVGWLLLAVGQRTPRAGRERKRRLGRGPVSSPAPTTAGAARGRVAVLRLRVKRTSKDRLGERISPRQLCRCAIPVHTGPWE